MFFGAGNLIFPLIVGREAGLNAPYAILGLGLSAVAFPLLGLIAMMFYRGNLKAFLERLGVFPAALFLLIFNLAQGPLGCMPRLITLMHASLKSYTPDLSLFVFSIVISAVVFWLTFRPQKIIDLLGVVLTPLLLLMLAALFVVGFLKDSSGLSSFVQPSTAFFQGLKGGYQTMDLIGALLFATVILPHLAQGTEHLPEKEAKKTIYKRMKGASFLAALLLMLSYIGLTWVAAHHSANLPSDLAPEDLLQAVAVQVLGPYGGLVASIAVFLACLTTAISLAAVFANYIKDLFKEKISHTKSLAMGLIVTGAMANIGFSRIIHLFEPILEILYPALILLCFLNIAASVYRFKPVKGPIFFILGFGLRGFCLNLF